MTLGQGPSFALLPLMLLPAPARNSARPYAGRRRPPFHLVVASPHLVSRVYHFAMKLNTSCFPRVDSRKNVITQPFV